MKFKSFKHTFPNGEIVEIDTDLASELLEKAKGRGNKYLEKLIEQVVKSAKE